MIPESLPEEKKYKSMAEKISSYLAEESIRPTEHQCKEAIGLAHLGIVALPRIEDDSYEQP